ncbi:MAG: DUF1049 domain-containing protein [Gammaproteobacteria bacterium]|nr:DUF1049 domain-containing protein [Gammaproteobacteria bacterium]
MIIKFIFSSICFFAVFVFCFLNQRPVMLDFYWTQISAPVNFWCLLFFFFGLCVQSLIHFFKNLSFFKKRTKQ